MCAPGGIAVADRRLRTGVLRQTRMNVATSVFAKPLLPINYLVLNRSVGKIMGNNGCFDIGSGLSKIIGRYTSTKSCLQLCAGVWVRAWVRAWA